LWHPAVPQVTKKNNCYGKEELKVGGYEKLRIFRLQPSEKKNIIIWLLKNIPRLFEATHVRNKKTYKKFS